MTNSYTLEYTNHFYTSSETITLNIEEFCGRNHLTPASSDADIEKALVNEEILDFGKQIIPDLKKYFTSLSVKNDSLQDDPEDDGHIKLRNLFYISYPSMLVSLYIVNNDPTSQKYLGTGTVSEWWRTDIYNQIYADLPVDSIVACEDKENYLYVVLYEEK